jgi:polyhydroxyalkanoate synthesis regulator phasin
LNQPSPAFPHVTKGIDTMNTSKNFFDIVQQGFRVTVGAAASLVETIQDPNKRDITISEFRTELQNRTTEWSEKGEMTEQEARKFLENILQKNKSSDPGSQEIVTTATEVKDQDVENEIKVLTQQIVVLKTELEALRQGQSEDSN